MSDDRTGDNRTNDSRANDKDLRAAEDVLDLFNAGDVIENPEAPLEEPESTADDADAPAPG